MAKTKSKKDHKLVIGKCIFTPPRRRMINEIENERIVMCMSEGPDGEYLAISEQDDTNRSILIFRIEDAELIAHVCNAIIKAKALP